MSGDHPAVADLLERIGIAEARAGHLLRADERAVIAQVRRLEGPAALLLARLAARRTSAWRATELRAAGVEAPVEALRALAGLVDDQVPWEDRLRLARVEVLADGCRRLGLPTRGRREALVGRLAGREGWDDAPWVRLVCAGTLLRLDRWATFEVAPDPSRAVLDRMGLLRWPSYATTSGAIVPDRAAWDRWETLVDGWEALSDGACAAALDEVDWPPGGLDLRRALAGRLLERATALTRAGDVAGAEAALRALAARPVAERGEAGVRLVRLLAASGRADEAATVARDLRGRLAAGDELALARTARRLGGWPPDPPLRAARARDVRLVGERTAQGPRFGGATVEPAVAGWLVEQGREVIVSEGQAWRTLLALLFVDVMFMPVDGQLPVPLLAGPLDWGTPAFAQRRAEAVDAVWASLEAGEGPERVLSGWERWQGVRLRGARWEVASVSQLAALAAAPGLRAVLEPLLLGGSRAARGLPDLVVLPGPAVRLSGAFPSGLSERLTLVELKTENDALRDDQAAWHDRLARAGLDVELWRVQVIGA